MKSFKTEIVLTNSEKDSMQGLMEGINGAIYCLDGKQFRGRRPQKLPEGQHHAEFFGYKHKWAYCQNNQALVSYFGFCHCLVTG